VKYTVDKHFYFAFFYAIFIYREQWREKREWDQEKSRASFTWFGGYKKMIL